MEYQYGEWLKANWGHSRSPSKRDMGKTDASGAMDESGDLPRQTENKLMHGRWRTEVTEQTQTGFSGDWSDNGRPDKGKAVIPRAVTEIQEVESMDKGDSAYVKDENAVNVGIDSGSVRGNSNKDSNPIVEACTLVSIIDGVDDSSTLNLKGDKEW